MLGAGHGSGVVVDVIQDVPKSLRYAVQRWTILKGPMPPFQTWKHCENELVHPVWLSSITLNMIAFQGECEAGHYSSLAVWRVPMHDLRSHLPSTRTSGLATWFVPRHISSMRKTLPGLHVECELFFWGCRQWLPTCQTTFVLCVIPGSLYETVSDFTNISQCVCVNQYH